MSLERARLDDPARDLGLMTSTAWFSSLLSAESLGRGIPQLAARLCCLFILVAVGLD
jgi:hypothetical protein